MAATKPNLADALKVFEHLQGIVDLVARVLAKYPLDTVPRDLQPFIDAPRITAVRPSYDGTEIVLHVDCSFRLMLHYNNGPREFSRERKLRIPAEWLSMHQSQLTSAVRKAYWADAEHRLEADVQLLSASIEDHRLQIEEARKQIEHHSTKIDDESAELTALTERLANFRRRKP